jgi:hypothetical protein
MRVDQDGGSVEPAVSVDDGQPLWVSAFLCIPA